MFLNLYINPSNLVDIFVVPFGFSLSGFMYMIEWLIENYLRSLIINVSTSW
jgi:hypothetical protein